MQITILGVGKIKEAYLKDAIGEYLKRLKPFAKINVVEIAEEKSPAEPSLAQVKQIKEAEGERILQAIPAGAYHIALALEGDNLSSPELAKKIDSITLNGHSQLVFTIGGSWGLGDKVLSKADFLLSFGRMTFPHQLMRLILAEQVYRAYKISSGSAYHK